MPRVFFCMDFMPICKTSNLCMQYLTQKLNPSIHAIKLHNVLLILLLLLHFLRSQSKKQQPHRILELKKQNQTNRLTDPPSKKFTTPTNFLIHLPTTQPNSTFQYINLYIYVHNVIFTTLYTQFNAKNKNNQLNTELINNMHIYLVLCMSKLQTFHYALIHTYLIASYSLSNLKYVLACLHSIPNSFVLDKVILYQSRNLYWSQLLILKHSLLVIYTYKNDPRNIQTNRGGDNGAWQRGVFVACENFFLLF
eukprot:TRINITY_DN5476_c4_g1_i2.p1 TRINITY_DN5476_c4_g1~~TRINITY_DN5476_c4_g1_i2.p1  ORF type:complete len:251 (+),score=-22.73 TRINITY_DN5476_c4_g1_i2:2-754(+)